MHAAVLPNATHTYRLSLRSTRYRTSLIYRIVGACVLVIGLVVVWHPAGTVGGVVVFVLSLIRSLASDTRMTFALSPDGIEYRTLQRTITAQWQEVERIRQLRNLVQRWQAGDGLWLVRYRVTDGSPTRWMFADAFVPLAWFDQDWRDGVLGDDIRQYAPWLFADAAESRQ